MKRKAPMQPMHKSRRVTTLNRLQEQLKRGSKPSKEVDGELIPLTDKDKKRIETEIEVLKTRI
jgi:hypothetical protein